jgi:hypothetical protein
LSVSILERLEREPLAAFAEVELLRKSPADFEVYLSLGLLALQEPAGALTFSRAGSTYMARRDGGRLIGVEVGEDDPEVVEADESEIRRWRADLSAIAHHLHRENGLSGSIQRVTDRLWFLGDKSSRAVLLGLYRDEELLTSEVLSLPQRFPVRSRPFFVVCPSLDITPSAVRRLQDNLVEILRFSGAHPFRIAFTPRAARPSQSWHSEDYRTIFVEDEWRPLTTNQARVAELLDDVGAPMAEATILERLDIKSSSLYQVFRSSWAWNTLIVRAGKGLYQLNSPENHW